MINRLTKHLPSDKLANLCHVEMIQVIQHNNIVINNIDYFYMSVSSKTTYVESVSRQT